MPQTNQTKNSANSTLQSKNSANSKHFIKLGTDVLVSDLENHTFEEVITLGGKIVQDLTFDELSASSFVYQTKN